MESLAELRALHNRCSPSCITTNCTARGITLRLPGQGVLCIKCDDCTCFPRGNTPGKRNPDFVVLYCPGEATSSHWYIIEMKGSVSSIGDIVKQIQDGADVVQASPRFKVPGRFRKKLFPIVAHGGGVRANDFSRKRIDFFGKPYEIFLKRSGSSLV